MTYARILVAVDALSDAADTVLQRALQVGSDAEITVTHVVNLPPYVGDQVAFRVQATAYEEARKQAAERLQAVCAAAGIERQALLQGHVAKTIRDYAREQGVDLIVMGAHGRRGWRRMLGSTANAVLHGRTCDVLCVHIPEEPQPFRHALVAVDASEDAASVLSRAVAVAAMSGARVSIVTVVKPLEYTYAGIDLTTHVDPALPLSDAVHAHMRRRLDELATQSGVTGERLVRTGHPAEEIRAAADALSADVVVLGTHGRHGLGLLLGSTANGVLHGARTDVLAVLMPG